MACRTWKSLTTRQRYCRAAWITMAVVATVVLGNILHAKYMLRSELAAIRKAGYPASSEDLPATYPEPTTPHAGPLFERVFALIDFSPMREGRVPVHYNDKDMPKRDEVWSDDMMALSIRQVEANTKPAELIEQATAMQLVWFPFDLTYSFHEEGGPETGIWHARMVMHLRAIVMARSGDRDRAHASLLALWRLPRWYQQLPAARSIVRRLMMTRHALGVTEEVLLHCDLTEEQERELIQAIRETNDNRRGLIRSAATIRVVHHESIQRYPNRPGALAGSVHWLMWASSLIDRNAAAYLSVAGADFQRLLNGNADEKLTDQDQKALPSYCKLARRWHITFDDLELNDDERNQIADVTIVGLAVYQYRRKHGSLPSTLEQLVPEFLDAVPADRFGTGPLRYVRAGNGAVVYSVGLDGTDDGGREIGKLNTRFYNEGSDITFTLGNAQRELWPEQWTTLEDREAESPPQ